MGVMGNSEKCTGIVKSTGKRCKKDPIAGTLFCGKHTRSPGGRPTTTGKQSKYTCEALGGSIDKFRNDPDIKCLRDEVAVLRALLENIMGKLVDDPTQLADVSPALMELCNNIGKQVERLVKIEDGLKLNVSVVDIHMMVNQVVEILTEEIGEESVLEKLKKRLAGLSYSGAM